jgi:hypothetical protein
MSSQVCTLYGANRSALAIATAGPRSKTSGARSVPLSCSAALISSWLEASGCADSTSMSYFSEKVSMISP